MFTAVYTPDVCTLINVSLRTVITMKLFQPNVSTTGTAVVLYLRSDIPDSIASTAYNNRSATMANNNESLCLTTRLNPLHSTTSDLYNKHKAKGTYERITTMTFAKATAIGGFKGETSRL